MTLFSARIAPALMTLMTLMTMTLALAACSSSPGTSTSTTNPAPAAPGQAATPQAAADVSLSGPEEHLSAVVAEVNGQPIYYAFYEQSLNYMRGRIEAARQASSVEGYLNAKFDALERLIDDELLYQQAGKEGMLATEDEVRGELARAIAGAGSEEKFFGGMRTQRISRFDAVNGIRKRLSVNKYVKQRITSRLSASDAEAIEYYNANLERFTPEAWVKLFEISVLASKNAAPDLAEKARRRAEKILAHIRAGESFEGMAKEYSEDSSSVLGGAVGFVKRGATYPEFDAVMFAMKPGEVSDVIRTKDGFHILKVAERTGGEVKPFETVKEDCRRAVMTRKQAEMLSQITSGLRSTADIVSHLK